MNNVKWRLYFQMEYAVPYSLLSCGVHRPLQGLALVATQVFDRVIT